MTTHADEGAAPNADTGSAAVMTSAQRTRLILSGAIDLQLSAEFLEAVLECEERALPLDVDLRNVTFMDSSGIATLSRLVSADSPVLPVRLIKPPDVVRFLLDVTGLADQVTTLNSDPGFPSPGRGEPA
ncbi:MAG: STAS domain-containing protein [Bowdeniella nasicola]|nr:STAS domain-containing protein [Bowdeniella nasicola]